MSLSLPSRERKKATCVLAHSDANVWGNSSITEKRKKVKVALLICNDVLVQVFDCFDRRQLAKLEGICRRFRRIVVGCFNAAPFLVFGLKCYVKEEPKRFSKILSSPDAEEESGGKFELVTGVALVKPDLKGFNKHVFFKDSASVGAIPAFVCLQSVCMSCFCPAFARLLPLLRQFSGNFIKSLDFQLEGWIGSPFCGTSLTAFTFCLHKLFSIFKNCSPQFTFSVTVRQIEDTIPLIGSTLQLASVKACSSVCFLISTTDCYLKETEQSQNVDAILDWCHLQCGSETPYAPVRHLTIGSGLPERNCALKLDSTAADFAERLVDALKQHFLCSITPCRPFHLKLALHGKFASIANEALEIENKETDEKLIIQSKFRPVIVPTTMLVLGSGITMDINYSYTEIIATRQRLPKKTK